MSKSLVLILLLITLPTFGQTQPKKIKLHDNAKAMRQELEKQIPIGIRITDAQQTLQANGFNCTMKQQTGFIEINENKSVVEHNNIDFLLCEKRKPVLTNTRVWQVAVIHLNGVVSDLLNSVDTSPVLRKKDYVRMSDAELRSVLLKFAPIGSTENQVTSMLRDVFHRDYEKNSDYREKNTCYTCPMEKGGFTLESKMQRYNWRFLQVNYVFAVWYFDKNGLLTDVKVSHEWDGV